VDIIFIAPQKTIYKPRCAVTNTVHTYTQKTCWIYCVKYHYCLVRYALPIQEVEPANNQFLLYFFFHPFLSFQESITLTYFIIYQRWNSWSDELHSASVPFETQGLTSYIQFQYHCYSYPGTFSCVGVKMYYIRPEQQTLMTYRLRIKLHTPESHKIPQSSDFQNSWTATAPMLGCYCFSFAVGQGTRTRPACFLPPPAEAVRTSHPCTMAISLRHSKKPHLNHIKHHRLTTPDY